MEDIKPELPGENRGQGNRQDHGRSEQASGLDGRGKLPVLASYPQDESQKEKQNKSDLPEAHNDLKY
jgi:hypothetical protein